MNARLASPTIRQPLTRVEGKLKVTGAATYSAEVARPRLAYGTLIQHAIANGRVSRIDLSAAQTVPGVIGILTRENAPRFKPYPDDLTKKGAPGESRVPLEDDQVHWVGQHLGVVVAESFEQAMHAASLVWVEYENAPPILTLPDERAQQNSLQPEKFIGRENLQVKRGEVDAALASAAARIDVTYTTPIDTHNPIETYSTTAEWEAADRLLIHEATRGMKRHPKIVANAFSVALENVHIVCP